MNLLSWNCRGLGNKRAVRVLGELLKSHKLDLVFLSETLSISNKIEEISLKFGFANLLIGKVEEVVLQFCESILWFMRLLGLL